MSTFLTSARVPAAMFRVFRIPAVESAKVDAVLKDDVAGRQSILVRDARSLGVPGDGTIVLVEGSEAGVARAEALLKDVGKILEGREAEEALARFRSQDDDAASGMGLVFGA